MRIVIAGCGRLGASLATQLDHGENQITVVDTNPHAFRRLESEFRGSAIVGTTIDEDVLLSAGIEAADVFFAVTDADNTNLMAAQVAKRVFGVPRVSARVYDSVRAEVFRSMDINSICPTIAVSALMIDAVGISTAAETA
ncbi:MAG: NAD-binding protein [Chloroflexota bacterium]